MSQEKYDNFFNYDWILSGLNQDNVKMGIIIVGTFIENK
jgi:hypothetical protein